jgi:hypothetical protein
MTFIVYLRRRNGKVYEYMSKRAKSESGDEYEEYYDSAVCRAAIHFKTPDPQYNAYSGLYEFDSNFWSGRDSMTPEDMWVEEE